MSSSALVSPGTRFVAEEANTTTRPSTLSENPMKPLCASPWAPDEDTDARTVEGVHPAGPLIHVSRTKTSGTPFVSPATRLVAAERNATNRPSALMDEPWLFPCSPDEDTDARTVEGVHPAGAPKHVSRTKVSWAPFVSPATRLVAAELNAA